MKMKQSSSTAQNVLIEEVQVRGGFRSGALEPENKGVPAFAAVTALPSQEQLSPQVCALCPVLSWSFPAGCFQKLLQYTAAHGDWSVSNLFFQPAVCIQPSWKGMMDVGGQ